MIASRTRIASTSTLQPEAPCEASTQSQAPTFWTELDRVYGCLERGLDRAPQNADGLSSAPAPPLSVVPEGWSPTRRLSELFGLSPFELDILLLCAGAAVDRRFSAAIAVLQPHAILPTFGLAASVLGDPHWSAISRMRPLRYWNLVELSAGPLLQAGLSIDDRILQYLLGVPASDGRLDSVIHVLTPGDMVSPEGISHLEQTAARGALHWRRAAGRAILLTGKRASERQALFSAMCRHAGLQALVLDAGDLPDAPAERERLARVFTRESALWPCALLIKTERLEHAVQLQAWLQRVNAPIAIDVETGSAAEQLSGLRLAAPSMSSLERKAQWQRMLGPLSLQLNGHLDAMVEAFALDAREIRETAEDLSEEVLLRSASGQEASLAATAWTLCRAASRRSLDELAARVENTACWSDLVLPEPQTAILRQIALHARHAARVNGEWGFAARYARGLGLSVLFAGPSGTGKTMAAGVLGRELDRDLYQIDLATVVSKYIGETEKHLRKIFDAAERSGAILLFDEADALFGKRTQVRDSHDRYANLEISYLLQRMESYRGIAILTTNMQNALDPAFQRRLRFVVQFPFPDAASRERMWHKVFPAAAPVADLDFERLAQLNVTGGSIRNIALLAAFLAADGGAPIAMNHILEAARTEYAKLDKPLSAAETRGWE